MDITEKDQILKKNYSIVFQIIKNAVEADIIAKYENLRKYISFSIKY